MTKKCICASSVIINKDRVYVLKHKKLNVWLYPGGHVDEGEMPHETAVREALEETGFHIEILNTKNHGKSYSGREAHELPNPLIILYENVKYKSGKHLHFDMVYLARITKRKQVPLLDTESKVFRWVNKSEIKELDTYPNVKWTLMKAIETYGLK